MFRPRIIPCLLLKNGGLVKTCKFKQPSYIGDPINAVRILNEKEVDEVLFLDISKSKGGREPDCGLLAHIASECFIPFTYGGGIRTTEQIGKLLNVGIEKVSINTGALEDVGLVERAAATFGSQSIVVSIDVKRNIFGQWVIHSEGRRTEKHTIALMDYIEKVEQAGAGELLINSVDRDGTMSGYALDLIRRVTESVTIPVIACGGAGTLVDCVEVVKKAGASGAAAGSLFVYHGKHKAVLINYPEQGDIMKAFGRMP